MTLLSTRRVQPAAGEPRRILAVGWRSFVGSLGVHALLVAAVVRGATPPMAPADTHEPLEITVVRPIEPAPAPGPAPAAPPPARAVRAQTASVRRSVPVPEPPAPSTPSTAAGATAAPSAPEPARVPGEVRVPLPSEVAGTLGGPPPVDQLPAGALGGPIPPLRPAGGRHPLGDGVAPDGDGGYRDDHITFTSRVDRDGSVHFHDKANIGVDDAGVLPLLIFMSGHFDITDAIMRAHGEDPYRYEKARFMDATRDERAGMALRDRTDRLHDAVRRMPAYLDDVWGHTAWSAAERRAALYALWAEVAEDGAAEVVTTGRMVRATIVTFVRRRLPEGSPDGFTRAEIDALNARRSCTAVFEPYR
jgi:hypothetical protein